MTYIEISVKEATREQLEREVDRLRGLTDRRYERVPPSTNKKHSVTVRCSTRFAARLARLG